MKYFKFIALIALSLSGCTKTESGLAGCGIGSAVGASIGYAIDGGAIAKELGNSKVLNSVVLGLSAKHIGFTKEEWLDVVKSTVPPKTVEINEKAFIKGYES